MENVLRSIVAFILTITLVYLSYDLGCRSHDPKSRLYIGKTSIRCIP